MCFRLSESAVTAWDAKRHLVTFLPGHSIFNGCIIETKRRRGTRGHIVSSASLQRAH